MKALLLLAFGGPRSLDEVEIFLTRLFKGRKPSAEQLREIKERYRQIGGASPLFEITWRQAKALEEKLKVRGYSLKSYVGMRYGYPLIKDTLEEVIRDGLREIIALPMTPFRSCATTGAYIEEATRIAENLGEEVKISFIEGWYLHPLFLEAVRGKIQEGIREFKPEERKRVHLLFTAHSLPKKMIENDPYIRDFEASVRGVLQGMELMAWKMAYQSKGGGLEEWVGPDVESVLRELSEHKVREVLIIPIGFVSDHIEILYDIDILYQEKAKLLKMVLKRTSSLNDSEHFIEALASIVEEHL